MKKTLAAILLSFALGVVNTSAQSSNELRFCLHSDPKTFNPNLVADDASETIRYLTGGVLVRLNRSTQQLEPGLATSWKVSADGTSISFRLRTHLQFSDGTAFTADDVAFTMNQLMDPSVHSPTADAFRSGDGRVISHVEGVDRVSIKFPAPVVGLDKLFDSVAIMSAHSSLKEGAVLGPYQMKVNKPGVYLLLTRNPNYWKHDAAGRPLPYMDSIRLDIQQNRDTEMLRLLRGEIDLINSLDAAYFDTLKAQMPGSVYDAGVSLDAEQMWFNQASAAPLPSYKKSWFQSTAFRRAVSDSIHRDDLARIVYRGHARPAIGWISPANRFWFNANLRSRPFNQDEALALLRQDGFYQKNGKLFDRDGHLVEFSIITNAGNKPREQMATMIQQDLAGIGMHISVVTLDFPSLIERITRSFDYEACLLGLANNDLDPNTQMNVWLSSSDNHQWNPSEKTPATPWEAEIDRLMRGQASTMDVKKRKQQVDRVQEIVWQQEPFIYLINKDAMSAVSPMLHAAHPVVLHPQAYWNIEELSLGRQMAGIP